MLVGATHLGIEADNGALASVSVPCLLVQQRWWRGGRQCLGIVGLPRSLAQLWCWQRCNDKPAVGRMVVLAHWSDDESLAGWVRVFARWRNGESAAGRSTVLARWRHNVHSQHGGWGWRLGSLFGRFNGGNGGETMVFWYHHSPPLP